jgi:hypothetical protein
VNDDQPKDGDSDLDALAAQLRAELGAEADGVPPPPPPARPPTGLGRVRTRAVVASWRLRSAVPEPVKAPFRRLLGRPLPADLARAEEPSDLVRAVEELQVGQLELARRVSELEQRLAEETGSTPQ